MAERWPSQLEGRADSGEEQLQQFDHNIYCNNLDNNNNNNNNSQDCIALDARHFPRVLVLGGGGGGWNSAELDGGGPLATGPAIYR